MDPRSVQCVVTTWGRSWTPQCIVAMGRVASLLFVTTECTYGDLVNAWCKVAGGKQKSLLEEIMS